MKRSIEFNFELNAMITDPSVVFSKLGVALSKDISHLDARSSQKVCRKVIKSHSGVQTHNTMYEESKSNLFAKLKFTKNRKIFFKFFILLSFSPLLCLEHQIALKVAQLILFVVDLMNQPAKREPPEISPNSLQVIASKLDYSITKLINLMNEYHPASQSQKNTSNTVIPIPNP